MPPSVPDWVQWFGKEKRYHTLNHYLKERFGQKVFKLSLDAGFTCPNRDGSKGWGGCSFCSPRGSGDFVPSGRLSLTEQMERGTHLVQKKWAKGMYIAYFQAYTNTYAPLSVLKQRYDEALQFPGTVGLAIATRPDCLSEAVCDLLAEYQEKTFLWVELGLQSIHPRTLQQLHVSYDFQDFAEAMERLKERSIPVCVHAILGLPGESLLDMHQTVETLTRFPLFGIKLHMLHVIRGTRLGNLYEQTPFPLLSLEEYVPLVVDLLEKIPPEIVIHRITGDGPKDITLAPRWTFHKLKVLSEIDRELKIRDSWQGKYCLEQKNRLFSTNSEQYQNFY